MQEIQNWRLERSRNKAIVPKLQVWLRVTISICVLGGEDHGFSPTPVPAVSRRNWQNKVRIVTYCVSSSHTCCNKYSVSSSHTCCNKYCVSSSHTRCHILCILLTHTVPHSVYPPHTHGATYCVSSISSHPVPQSLPDTVLIQSWYMASLCSRYSLDTWLPCALSTVLIRGFPVLSVQSWYVASLCSRYNTCTYLVAMI